MEDETPLQKSFSAWKRWGFGFDLVVRTALVLAVVLMVNYLGARWYQRFYLSAATRQELSPRTTGLLKSITNRVNVILYYDREDPLFTSVTALLNEYRDLNSHLHVATVDYIRDIGAAENLKATDKYRRYLTGVTNKNLVLFECEGTIIPVNGLALGQSLIEPDPDGGQSDYRKRTMFYGERRFTEALLAVINPKQLKAYYLIGHGEHRLNDAAETGYQTFLSVLQQDNIKVEPLELPGTNAVPADCNLLIIAGPTKSLEAERERIDDYLHQGGRMLALLNFGSLLRPTGLEKILAGWGVNVANGAITDPERTTGARDVKVEAFSSHPVVNSLRGSGLHLILPRPVGRLEVGTPPADAPRVDVLAGTSAAATVKLASGQTLGPTNFPLAVAVEKSNPKGVITERGSTRILAVGDSLFLGNQMIESAGNKDFLGYAVNWLLERTQLMQGLGPKPVAAYRLSMTTTQQQSARWLMLAAIPGGVLAFGGLVWLRRRK
jgi:hypothetical protein